ncbi:MAG: ribosome biogenesis GTP-binding protein YihA/YsxC [Myxococcota bacterium]
MKILRAEPLDAAADRGGFPPPGAPEVAFLGRSNVGKSSLLNKLVQRKALARTSSTPGKTRLVHWYRVERSPGGESWLVDLPCYGYAKVSEQERLRWQKLVESYLEGRETLRVAVLLQDLRRDVTEDETLLIDWLSEREVPVLVALTKCDKLKPMRRAQRVKVVRAQLGLPAAQVIATSAEKGFGIPELWKAIGQRV